MGWIRLYGYQQIYSNTKYCCKSDEMSTRIKQLCFTAAGLVQLQAFIHESDTLYSSVAYASCFAKLPGLQPHLVVPICLSVCHLSLALFLLD